MRKDRHAVVSQPMEDFDWLIDFDSARDEKKCPIDNHRPMQCGKLCRTKLRLVRHEIFLEQIGMLDHRPFERFKNHASFLQSLRNDRALYQLIIRENHSPRDLIETARVLENISSIVFRKWTGNVKSRQIKKINIGKSPELIFPGRTRNRFEFFPGSKLLF